MLMIVKRREKMKLKLGYVDEGKVEKNQPFGLNCIGHEV